MVRKANGKNSRKLEFTAAGLPVFSAIAYGNPGERQPPRTGEQQEHQASRATPVEKLTPTIAPSMSTGIDSAMTSAKSATIRPSSSAGRLIGVSSSRSK